MTLTRRGVLTGAGATAAGALAAGCGSNVKTEGKPRAYAPGDSEVLRVALFVEDTLTLFYTQVAEGDALSGRDRDLVDRIAEQDRAHLDAVERAARRVEGFVRPARPHGDFSAVISKGRDAVLRTAGELEGIGAAAYLGQITVAQNSRIVRLTLAIHANESRHAAALERTLGHDFSPEGPFASGLDGGEAVGRLKRILARGGA